MIFVTAGTTYFDELIREMDRLACSGVIEDHILSQIGSGAFIPQHMEWVRYVDNMREVMNSADVVVCAGGATVFELLVLGKRFIAVPNRHVKDDHQAIVLRQLESEGWCNCCWDMSQLETMLRDVPPCKPYPREPELPRRLWADLFPDLTAET